MKCVRLAKPFWLHTKSMQRSSSRKAFMQMRPRMISCSKLNGEMSVDGQASSTKSSTDHEPCAILKCTQTHTCTHKLCSANGSKAYDTCQCIFAGAEPKPTEGQWYHFTLCIVTYHFRPLQQEQNENDDDDFRCISFMSFIDGDKSSERCALTKEKRK